MSLRFRDVLLYMLAGVVIVGGAVGMLDAVMAPSAGANGKPAGGLAIPFVNPLAHRDRVNILLIGADDRVVLSGKFEPGRSDTIMVVSLNPQLKRAAMLSLPRDYLVTLPEVPKGVQTYPQKINHAYHYGGVKLARRTIERELGIHFDYYAKIDLKNFVKVVDMLGGVYLNVPDYEGKGRGMNYDDDWGQLHIHLKPGYQHLNGEQAMGFVRYRKSQYHARSGGVLGITDSERASNQQIFLKAMIEQKVRLSNLPSLLRAGGFVLQHIDTDMDWRTAVALMNVMRGLDTSKILHLTLPVVDKTIGGTYYCYAPPGKLEEMRAEMDAFLAGATDVPNSNIKSGALASAAAEAASPAAPAGPARVKILNGSGASGAARQAYALIRGSAVHLHSLGNADHYDYEQTVIEYVPGRRSTAQRLAAQIGVPGAELREAARQPGPAPPDITITLGRDFQTAADKAGSRHETVG